MEVKVKIELIHGCKYKHPNRADNNASSQQRRRNVIAKFKRICAFGASRSDRKLRNSAFLVDKSHLKIAILISTISNKVSRIVRTRR